MPSGVNAFEISDSQEDKLTPDQPDDQDVTMLHCAEKPLDRVFAEHNRPCASNSLPDAVNWKRYVGRKRAAMSIAPQGSCRL
jgi:hypothetical protein